MTRGNKLTRNSFAIGGRAKLSNKFTAFGGFSFTRTDYLSPPNAASFGSGVGFDGSGVFGDVLYTPRSVDLTNIPFQAADGRSTYYRSGNDIQNPYWTLANVKVTQETDRFNGNLNIAYELADWLNVSYRMGLDTYTELNTYGQNKGGVDGDPTGLFRTIAVRNTTFNHDVIFSADKDLSEDLNLKVILGGNMNRNTFTQDGMESTGQLVFGILKHYNFTTNSANNSFDRGNAIAYSEDSNQLGAYVDATLGYKNFLFLNAVGRNDWVSTLETENNSLFYPGGSVSFIPTAAFDELQGDGLNYLKLRVGYGSSAGFPDPYFTRNVLGLNARAFVASSGTVVSSNSVDNTLGNPDLKPEQVSEFEIGVDTRLFRRLNFNVSVYKKTTTDLITSLVLDDASGFDNTLINIGEIESEGIEIDFDLDVIKSNDDGFRFNLAGNFSANESIVTELAEGTDNIPLTDFVIGEGYNAAVEGRPFGVILGTTIQRDANGNRLVGNDGLYIINNQVSEIGDPNPDWTAALVPTFRYKGFTLSANIQYRHGGDIYSTTSQALIGRGTVDQDEALCRECNYILPGVLQNGSPNNILITATNVGFDTAFAGGLNSLGMYDGTTIRLQEASLSYDVPQSMLDKTPFGSLSFTLSGSNLWFKAVNFESDLNYDTNASSTGVGNGQGIDFITGPSARRYGLSVKATF